MNPKSREADAPVERIQWLLGSILSPERVSGWRAAFLVAGIASGVLLALLLLWLGFAAPGNSWKLVAFAAMFFSLCIWALAPLMPKRWARLAVGAGVAALVVSIVWIQQVPGG